MTTRVRLMSGSVHYLPDLVLHTAASGPISALDELYLVVERDGEVAAFGEIRENIAYLTGLDPATIRASIIARVASLDWSDEPEDIYARFRVSASSEPAVARALVDTTLVDWTTRARHVPASELFGAPFRERHLTNQSLFISDDGHFAEMAARYVARGFTGLKIRVGQRDFATDLRRIALLRDRLDGAIEIAIDANGSWRLSEAVRYLDDLSRYAILYAEQPIAAGDWASVQALAERSPIPIMLDESVSTAVDIDRVIDAGGKLWAHLKIVKLGGMTPTIEAGRRLAAARVPFMIGQMNEGAGATAAAYHCAVATSPAHAELYGADNLIDDPVSGVSYAAGEIRLGRAPGLGVSLDASRLKVVWEMQA